MKIVRGISTKPSFNLAMEEFFLKEKSEDLFMLWQNDKSIIVGRNQNAFAEINHEYVKKNNLPVIRRLTGGGAVFHDLGNLNYTFIKRDSINSFNNYAEFCAPVISLLRDLNIDAVLSGRNDMLIEGKKFSGNAQCAYKNSVMHHGTLLFSSQMSDLSKALNVNPIKIQSKGISSVKSRVTNISNHLNKVISIEEFTNALLKRIKEEFSDSQVYEFTEADIERIKKLENEKYLTWEWNFGYKKEFSLKQDELFEFGIVEICISINENKIEDLKVFGDFFGENDISIFESSFIGKAYKRTELEKVIREIDIDKYIKGADKKEILDLIIPV